MKNILTATALLLSLGAIAQCKKVQCEDFAAHIPVTGTTSSNTNGDACYSGDGLLYEYGTGLWSQRMITGTIYVGDTFRMPDNSKLYVSGFAAFDNLTAGSNTSIQVEGIFRVTLWEFSDLTFYLANDTSTVFFQGVSQSSGIYNGYSVVRCSGSTGITEPVKEKKYYRTGIYNLLGQQLSMAPVGIVYIENGIKKFILP